MVRPNNVVTQASRNTLSRSETQMGKSPYKKLENTFDTDMLVKPTKLTFSEKIKKILVKMKIKEYKAERFILFCGSYGLVILCSVLGFLGKALKHRDYINMQNIFQHDVFNYLQSFFIFHFHVSGDLSRSLLIINNMSTWNKMQSNWTELFVYSSQMWRFSCSEYQSLSM